MAQQNINLGTDSTGADGDTNRIAWEKAQANFTELYQRTMKNLLINCGLPVNQRGFGGGALAAGAYGYDRWKAGPGGCNISIDAATGVFAHASGALQQIVESPQGAWGQPLTISVEDPSSAINVTVGGAAGTIPAGSGRRGVTLTPLGSGNMTVQLSAAGATYSRPQLERGSAAGAFDWRPRALEMALCQWYCRAGSMSLRSNGTGSGGGGTYFGISMRDTPAVSFSSVNYIYGCSNIGASVSATGVEIFVSATGVYAFLANYLLEAEL